MWIKSRYVSSGLYRSCSRVKKRLRKLTVGDISLNRFLQVCRANFSFCQLSRSSLYTRTTASFHKFLFWLVPERSLNKLAMTISVWWKLDFYSKQRVLLWYPAPVVFWDCIWVTRLRLAFGKGERINSQIYRIEVFAFGNVAEAWQLKVKISLIQRVISPGRSVTGSPFNGDCR